jgi:hypothetical protein
LPWYSVDAKAAVSFTEFPNGRGPREQHPQTIQQTNQQSRKRKRGRVMNHIIKSFGSSALAGRLGAYLAATATVGVLALGASALFSRAHADARWDESERAELAALVQKAQLYEISQLEVGFHRAGSYGGNLDALMELWADDATFTSGTNVYSGKDAIRAVFGSGGAYTHYWVGLTAAFKLTAELHGDTAELSFQCDYIDPSTTPPVDRADRILRGTIKRVNGPGSSGTWNPFRRRCSHLAVGLGQPRELRHRRGSGVLRAGWVADCAGVTIVGVGFWRRRAEIRDSLPRLLQAGRRDSWALWCRASLLYRSRPNGRPFWLLGGLASEWRARGKTFGRRERRSGR